MNLSAFCIRRPVFTVLLMASLLVAGVSGYLRLPVSALPQVDFPTIQVTASLPGASPETMASSVATPLERQFATIAGVSSMTSTSFLGNTQITLQFDLKRSIDGAALDVQSAISATLRRLPKEMLTPPSFQKVNPADQPVLFVALSSDTLPLPQVNEFADTLVAQRISSLPGVAQVVIYGAQKHAIRIQADPAKLEAQGLSFQSLQQSIAAAASTTPVGTISGEKQLFTLNVAGQPNTADAFRNLITQWKDGAPVRLGDIANVVNGVEEKRNIGFLNGKQAIIIAIQRQPDANTIDVVDRVRALLPQFRKQLPASIAMTPMFDRSVAIRNSLHDVQMTLLLTIALVVGVIYAFLRDRRATLIAGLAVPLSIIGTYGGMALLGFSINNVSLLALTLCVGLVVDDAIVMLENITRHKEMGKPMLAAALEGSREVGFTILSMTASLVAVFIPILFMGGVVGRLFFEFAATLSLAIIISGLVSLTLTPMLCSRWLDRGEGRGARGKEHSHFFDRIQNAYGNSLTWVMKHQRTMLGITLATLAASILGFMYSPKGFFPQEDAGFIFTITEAAQDISFDAMVEKQKQLAEVIRKDPAVQDVFYAVGGGRGALNTGRIFFGLKPRGTRPPVFAVIKRLRESTKQVQGISAFMQPVQNINIGGRLSKSLYQYTLQGQDLPTLFSWSEKLRAELVKQPGFIDVTSDLQQRSLQAVVKVDADKAASLGITHDDVRKALFYAFSEAQVATLYAASNDYAVILEAAPQYQRGPEDIESITLTSATGTRVPLKAIATIERAAAPLSINHQGQLPSVTLSFNLSPGHALSEAIEGIQTVRRTLQMPDDILGNFQGTAQIFQDSAAGQGWLLMATILVIYIILGMLYESFIHPITILSGLPSAGIGALITLFLFGMDLSIIAILGVILLVGIVKKNAIMMVDFALAARVEGASAEEAIIQAALTRFRPIMMTTLAALLGTLPIAIGFGTGAELRQPLGIAVVGGLITSQLLTLYITPVVFVYLEKLRVRNSESRVQ